MTDRQPKPCPNCESSDSEVRGDFLNDGTRSWRICRSCLFKCQFSMWQSLPRREDFFNDITAAMEARHSDHFQMMIAVSKALDKYDPVHRQSGGDDE